MARLPVPGNDIGTWGDILNDFLNQSHETDGSLKPNTVNTAQIRDGAIGGTKIAAGSLTEAHLDSSVQVKLNASAGAVESTDIVDSTAVGRSLLTATDATTAKTTLSLAKADVGLTNVDNTSDANKPISSSTQTALNNKAALVHTHTSTQITDMTTTGRSLMTAADAASAKSALSLSNLDIGLGNVDNTSDATKNSAIATITNKTISGASNTISNIGNSSLTNSTITIAGTSTALGSSITQDTITGLSGTGVVKRSGANTLAIATAGTDYATPSGSESLSNKTLGNTNTVTLKDTNFTLQDDVTATKQMQFQLSGITAGQTRTLTVPDANTTVVGTDVSQALTNKDLTSGTNTFPTFNQSTTGNAATATKLASARTIGGTSFDGSANISQPYDLSLIGFGATTKRVASSNGDNPFGIKLQRACTLTSVTFRCNTADASGSLVCELRKNGTQISGTSTTISAANQVAGGTSTGTWACAAGDIITIFITGVGTTPGNGLEADITGTTG